ncbi:L,D-transpeptidase [Bdellovibrio sp. SKB1291214]|uniref:L,D-transpeptidase n=1 Tax=Bdellovibrio sp. SKB1291214 TaxID=1732569 RepID=UPI000B51AD6E|nr:L,D-transpeptidase [Bdellovibrio sp. SKB1291214]UYL09656.1 L,D-transpeptidase [Bdellovibrio sp. SKB1291214]
MMSILGKSRISTAFCMLVATLTLNAFAASQSFAQVQITAVAKNQLIVGKTYYIAADNLNLRSSNSTTSSDNIVGQLSMNDEVVLVNALSADTPLVQIRLIKSKSVPNNVAAQLFVSKDYLSDKVYQAPVAKYFVIQNVATEKTRVYERCTVTPGCPHKLVMETDMVVGRNEEGTKTDRYAYMTWLGHSRIASWVKFYSDGMQTYPSWYTAGQDLKSIPSPISKNSSRVIGSRKWLTKKNGKDTVYGAFGWYAAKLSPSDDVNGVNSQWMHGTIGWGVDGSDAIDITRGFFMNMFSNPGSHGCTRLENRAIAYLREILPTGTDIYRVYARESTRERQAVLSDGSVIPLTRYKNAYNNPARWDYILLTDGAQKAGGLSADATNIITKNIPVIQGNNFLEQGSYMVDQYPTATPLNYKNSASSGKSGDRYRIDAGKEKAPTNFRGYFLVDEGRFIDYQHPDARAVKGKVKVSGLLDFRTTVPEQLKATGYHFPPAVIY